MAALTETEWNDLLSMINDMKAACLDCPYRSQYRILDEENNPIISEEEDYLEQDYTT